jgi:hypothetical protein
VVAVSFLGFFKQPITYNPYRITMDLNRTHYS